MVEQIKLPTYETLLTEAIRSLAVDSGIVSSPVSTGGNALTDSTKNWAPHIHKNRLVKIIRGLGVGQQAVIQDNSATTLVIRGSWPQAIGAGAVYGILSDVSLTPIEKANKHNTAEIANTNILAAALSSTNTPCLFRVMAAFDTAGIFRVTITKAGNTQTLAFNGGANLTANALYMFDHLVHGGDTINYQYSVNAQLLFLRVQEIIAGVQ